MGPFLLGFGAALGVAAWRADSQGAALIFVGLLVLAFVFGRRVSIANAVASAVAVAVSKAEAAANAQASAQVAVYMQQSVQGHEGGPPPAGERALSPLGVSERLSLDRAPLALDGGLSGSMERLRSMIDVDAIDAAGALPGRVIDPVWEARVRVASVDERDRASVEERDCDNQFGADH